MSVCQTAICQWKPKHWRGIPPRTTVNEHGVPLGGGLLSRGTRSSWSGSYDDNYPLEFFGRVEKVEYEGIMKEINDLCQRNADRELGNWEDERLLHPCCCGPHHGCSCCFCISCLLCPVSLCVSCCIFTWLQKSRWRHAKMANPLESLAGLIAEINQRLEGRGISLSRQSHARVHHVSSGLENGRITSQQEYLEWKIVVSLDPMLAAQPSFVTMQSALPASSYAFPSAQPFATMRADPQQCSFCPNCGSPCKQPGKFCTSCGIELPAH